jgi:hypothetical protein
MRSRAALVAVAVILAVAMPTIAGPMTPGDRQRLLAHLEMTEAWLVSELEGLSEAQLRFKMSPESWSITEVAEHLAIAEPQYWKNLTDSMAVPVREGYEPQATDADILWYGIDRTDRSKTGEARVPHGAYPSAKESLAAFRALRKTMLETAKTSPDDFRGRALVGGNMDVYQWFLMISTHSQRHILQIREIKASAGYPRS